MATQFTWKCSIPSDGLRDAMERIALQVADKGGYSHVEILSNPKTTTGNPVKSVAPYFKVKLMAEYDGAHIETLHLIKIEHQSTSGASATRFQRNNRGSNYPYHTLQTKNGPPSSCPRKWREDAAQSLTGAAASAPDGQDSANDYQDGEAAEED